MSAAEKTTSPCNKFQANIFNKSKCQNCFKSRELHLTSDRDMEQAKPIYGGWLCLAPEGTDFDNPMQRSRKWQRRFFILYEHGSLSFALDELLSTLPQGTVNLNLCTEITDAEPRTGQRNALCIVTSEQEIFIRGDNKEIINGWSEQLGVFLRTNKQNQKKKRKVERVPTQEPSPAKMAATDPSLPSSESDAESGCGRWQEDQRGKGAGVTPMWTVTDVDPPGPEQNPAGSTSTYLCPVSTDSPSSDAGFVSPVGSLDLVAGGNTDAGSNKQTNNNIQTSANKNQRLLGSEAAEKVREGAEEAESRTGRSANKREKLQSCGDVASLAAPPAQRRSRSLDRRTSDNIMTPDLLNFKKGWMVKLDEHDQWKKYWFVLSADSLRFYKDSLAEEASDLEGEIDLTKCFNVSEYQVQRNYGFQIHTPHDVYTLSAMTSGIRKNWIQALMKNVHPANAPDVASLPGLHAPPEALPKPDVTQDSPSADVSAERDSKHRTVMERRREGRYRTFDWAEFRPQNKASPADADPQRTKAPCSSLELGDLERRKRREERRRRYESMLGISLSWEVMGDKTEDSGGGGVRALSPKSQQKVEEDIEECWRLVEKTIFRLERNVPLITEDKEETETLLDSYRTKVEDLKSQLAESERCRLDLETQLSTTGFHHHQQTLKDTYEETRELLEQQNVIRQSMQEQLSFDSLTPQTPSIWLHDADGNLQELDDLLSPASESDAETEELQKELDGDDGSEINKYGSLILETSAERDDASLNCCHVPPDQAAVRRLSQEVERLTSQNEALNQRNQEMLNQLTEADREIERLKVELSGRYAEPQNLPEVEQTGREDLQRELSVKNQQLLEAQAMITSLEENLKETEALLQKTGQEESDEKAEGYLLRSLEDAEARLTELERRLHQSEMQNAELKEAEQRYRQTAAEAEADVRRLNEELQTERSKHDRRGSGDEKIQEVTDGMVTRLNALEKLLEVIDTLDGGLRTEESEEATVERQLRWEEEFCSLVLDKLKSSELNEVEVILSEVMARMMVEKQMLLLGHRLLSETDGGLNDVDVTWNKESETEERGEMFDFKVVTQVKMSSLNRLASSASSSTREQLWLMADRLSDFNLLDHPWSGFIHSAATEAMFCLRLSRLRSKYEKQIEEQKLDAASLVCSNCDGLTEENRKLRERLTNMEQSSGQKVNTCSQTDELQVEEEEDEMVDCRPVDGQSGVEETLDENTEEETDPSFEAEHVSELRRRVEELEEQLSVMEEVSDGKMSSLQTRHEKETEKLKVTCERGFATMEECHVKIVEELQRRHRQEVERLLLERDRLLEEESAATATAIVAIKNAHRLELEREIQRRSESESSSGDSHLEDVFTRHSEELTSYQRELQVLSQQFSLKCLENGHLVQALDAERKALCQCQQENQDLRTRNQELSAHLAAEITRLCSLAKQDELPLSQKMDAYEMEITLRVKESEVQCLKQELTSLKDELQSAQKDKRNATKKYKDVLTELSITRAKAERELDELRENLRLAHRALHQT
ncbi:myosin phosphatase Rho-interacting protein isoform X3 [Larimichthys crocea]|uniref:myosin phosphatase Rho-interacting protein isoform X3 n=1 Tax=Larimichthys crocea TaxID=215358 RepID=UPI000F5F2CD1|nr:myosin phosphatase Rho-interacting protein isoform X3 [Larimichthys crocea]